MHYSLLNRFQGTLLGAALGEILGTYGQTSISGRQGRWTVEPSVAPAGWGRVAVDFAHCLLEGKDSDLPAAIRPAGATGLATAALPIALFFHEDPEKLCDRLSKMVTRWGGDAEMAGGVLAVGHAIALALQERLHPADLIPQLLSDLDLPTRNPHLASQLLQVQAGVEQRIGLSQAKLQSDLSIAFYCFLSTPEDYSLTVRRCVNGKLNGGRLDGSAVAVAGALSGVYNSRTGIPLDWRRSLNHSTRDSPLVRLWNLDSAADLDCLAAQLLAVWSGMYQPADADHPPAPIAAPQVIRPR